MSRSAPLLLQIILGAALLGCRTPPAELPQTRTEAEPARTDNVFVEAQPSTHDAAPGGFTAINAEIAALYRCWFSDPYSYMFAYDGELLDIGNKRFGMLMAGIHGILYYGDLNTCAGELTGHRPASYADIGPIETLAGVPATVDAPGLEFDAVNPELIFYARRQLLPSPDQSIDGIPVQVAYDHVFQRFFRLMAVSVMVLLDTTKIDAEMNDYLSDTMAGTDGIDWLEGRYAGRIPELGGGYRDGTMMTPSMAAGFWLRRRADGSFAACWHGLRDVLDRFDPVWLAEQKAIYPKAAASLEQLVDPLKAQP